MNQIKLDLSAYDLTNTDHVSRFLNVMQSTTNSGSLPYGVTAEDIVVAYVVSGELNLTDYDRGLYAQFAAKLTEEYLQVKYLNLLAAGKSANVQYDQYLNAGGRAWDVGITISYCAEFMKPEMVDAGLRFLQELAFNVQNPTLATWGGVSFKWPGWAVNSPGNNYYYSRMRALMVNALLNPDTADHAYLESRLQLMEDYYSAMQGGGSDEGTGYGKAQGAMYSVLRLWKANGGRELPSCIRHANENIRYIYHATSPDFTEIANIGDQSRISRHIIDDTNRSFMLEARSLATDPVSRALATDWLRKIPHKHMAKSMYLKADLLDAGTESATPNVLSYHAETVGHKFIRTDWTKDAFWWILTAGPNQESHDQDDQGGISLWYHGWQFATQNMLTHSGIRGEPIYQNVLQFIGLDGESVPQLYKGTATIRLEAYDNGIVRENMDMDSAFASKYGIVWGRFFLRDESNRFSIQDHFAFNPATIQRVDFQLNTPFKPEIVDQTTVRFGAVTLNLQTDQGDNPPQIEVVNWKELDPKENVYGGYKIVVKGGKRSYFASGTIDKAFVAPVEESPEQPIPAEPKPKPIEDQPVPEFNHTVVPTFPAEITHVHIAKRGDTNAANGKSWHYQGASEIIPIEQLQLDDLVATCTMSTDGKTCVGVAGGLPTSSLRRWVAVKHLGPDQLVHGSTGAPRVADNKDGIYPDASRYVTYVSADAPEPVEPDPEVPDTTDPEPAPEVAVLLRRISFLENEMGDLVETNEQQAQTIGLQDARITALIAELGAADEENLEIKQKIRAYRDAELALDEAIGG